MTKAGIDAKQFRNALGAFTTGVTIVTTCDREGNNVGLTVNSFNSVSLDPPLVLWSLARSSASLDAFLNSEYFAVHILAADQEQLSNLFAQRGADKFAGLTLEHGHGNVPLLGGCSARFECRRAFRYDGGDHEIFIGEVLTFEHFERPPLVFQGGKYALAMQKAKRSQPEPLVSEVPDYQFARQNVLHILLGMAYHQLTLNFAPELERFGLKEDEYWLLNILGAVTDPTLDQLDKQMSFAGKHVTSEQLSILESRGFLQLDKREGGPRAFLTDQGRQVLIEGAAINQAIEGQAEGGLDYSETQLLKQLLQRVVRQSHRYVHKAA